MCGIVGILGKENAAGWVREGLFAQQHRGQDSCGLAVVDNGHIKSTRMLGLVRDSLTPEVLAKLHGERAIGHVRYPTQGDALIENAQPHVFIRNGTPLFALSSNGDITNLPEIRADLLERGYEMKGTNDAEVISSAIGTWAYDDNMGLSRAIERWMRTGKGAYSTLLLSADDFYAFRDPGGFRPMCMGEKDGTFIVASETVVLDTLRARLTGFVEPGSIVRISEEGFEKIGSVEGKGHSHCIFEHIYFARPDSRVFSENVFEVRERIGKQLADGDDLKADVVIPIPDSANYIGLAYAHARSIPFVLGLVRNHYIGRTFISPDQLMRDDAVRLKFNPLRGFIEGKRVILVDDSIVRGTTIRKLIGMMRENGAEEVHLRIGSPPIRHSCYYGIDTPVRSKLIASERTAEVVARSIEADSLRYLSIDKLRKCVNKPDHFCYACFNGHYPAGEKTEGDTVHGG